MEWYLKVLNQYADFKGRARRQEYWMFALINGLATIVLYALAMFFSDSAFGLIFMAAYVLYALAVFVPSLAVLVRRLHDTNRSGWWFFIAFIPIVGPIVLLVWLATEGTYGANNYGYDPKDPEAAGMYQDTDILDADI